MKAVVDTNVLVSGLINMQHAPGRIVDSPFLEVAIAANVPLITGNLKHFPEHLCRGHRVMAPSEFMGWVC